MRLRLHPAFNFNNQFLADSHRLRQNFSKVPAALITVDLFVLFGMHRSRSGLQATNYCGISLM